MAGERYRRRIRALMRRLRLPGEAQPLVEQAFVHSSAVPDGGARACSNERLEFLGDSVLGLAAADHLERSLPDADEGELSRRKARLVSGALLAESARRLGLGDLLVLAPGAAAAGAADRPSLLADAFEALIAAIFRAQGLAAAQAFVEREHFAHVDEGRVSGKDAKTTLQEWAAQHVKCLPVYEDSVAGLPHERAFTSRVSVAGRAMGSGTGPSKRSAQQAAAAQALDLLQREAAREQDVR
ncbi:MAG TPA: ribonuclease III [Candidatus Dormibacteraeota bacterium]|nr:ribonuclease III [Candidatus Dormibacteraeota bacterium]